MKKTSLLIALLCVAKFVLPFVLQNSIYEPHRDEFLYFAQGKHPAFGYLENPPLLSWLTTFFPATFFAIKFWPALLGSLTFFLAAKMVVAAGGRRFAVILVFLAFIFSGYLRAFFLYQPNAPEIFFCTLAAFALYYYLVTKKTSWIYLLNISLAFGILSKYSVAFFAISLFIGLLFTRYRNIFLRKNFYFAALIALLLLLPNILWQYEHNFPLMIHMQELKETQLQYVSKVDFLSGQMMMFLPVVYLWIGGLLYSAFYREAEKFRVFAFTWLLLLVILLVLKGKAYYMLPVYPVLFAAGAVLLEKPATRWFLLKPLLVFATCGFGIFILPFSLPVFKPEKLASYYKNTGLTKEGFRWEDHKKHPLPQDFSDMLGWEEVAAKTASAYNSLSPEERENTIVFCGNYGEAGAVNFYPHRGRRPPARSANGSFILWMGNPDYDNVVLVLDENPEKIKPVLDLAGSYKIFATVKSPHAREKGTSILVIRNTGPEFKKAVASQWEEKLALLKGSKF